MRSVPSSHQTVTSILSTLLGGNTPSDFLRETFGSKPFASAGAAERLTSGFGWKGFELLLCSPALDEDALVVSQGRTLNNELPRSLTSLRRLFGEDAGVVVRKAERHLMSLGELASRFASEMEAGVTLQVFATPAGSHSFGWHYDFEHVFILQTQGIKDYYFRANTVDPHQLESTQPDFSVFAQEKSPLMHARLHPTDWLYLPPRWWHMAKCRANALSVSIGLRVTR